MRLLYCWEAVNISLIKVSHLTFAYDGGSENIFGDVSFQLDTDWKLGFTGRNGRGKTTFLKLLMGAYEYRGSIDATVEFGYFPFGVPDDTRAALAVIQGICPEAALWEIERELSLLSFPEEALRRPFSTLSGGERTKALLSALFLKENFFPLVDEPTNHLDMEARETVGGYLKSKKGFILVSHDRAFLDGCVDHILAINKTNIEVRKGNFSNWWRDKEARDEAERAENENLKKDIKRLTEAARRAAGWSDKVEKTKFGAQSDGQRVADRGQVGHKAAKMMKRSKAIESRREGAAAEKARLLKNVETAESLSVQPLVYHTERLLEAAGLSIRYGSETVCAGVSFTVNRGDRIALRGKNGCGKSSVLRLIAGESVDYTGILRVGSGLAVSYVPQDASFLQGGLREFARDSGIDETLFKAILRKLDFSREQFGVDMAAFSAGQKKKVLLAKSLCQRAHLYVWDEPLNYVDVVSRIQIEELLTRHKPAMLFVEHDAAFTGALATGAVDIRRESAIR